MLKAAVLAGSSPPLPNPLRMLTDAEEGLTERALRQEQPSPLDHCNRERMDVVEGPCPTTLSSRHSSRSSYPYVIPDLEISKLGVADWNKKTLTRRFRALEDLALRVVANQRPEAGNSPSHRISGLGVAW
jgi:hypothetical protein